MVPRVIPVSAHAAFDKAGAYFGIKVIHVPVEEQSRKVDLDLMKRSITADTIMVHLPTLWPLVDSTMFSCSDLHPVLPMAL